MHTFNEFLKNNLMTGICTALVSVICLSTCFSVQAQDPLRFQSQVENLLESKQHTPGAHIIFTGSSSIKMWETLSEDFPEYQVANKGFGGSHMSDLNYFLDDLVLSSAPCQVFIYEGDNDLNSGKSPDQIIEVAQSIIDQIYRADSTIDIVLIAAKPSVSRWHLREKYEALNMAFSSLAEENKRVTFADVWTPALDAEGEVLKDIFLSDNLHMNAKGYANWKKVLGPLLAPCARK